MFWLLWANVILMIINACGCFHYVQLCYEMLWWWVCVLKYDLRKMIYGYDDMVMKWSFEIVFMRFMMSWDFMMFWKYVCEEYDAIEHGGMKAWSMSIYIFM
jgi:hypothetical protein